MSDILSTSRCSSIAHVIVSVLPSREADVELSLCLFEIPRDVLYDGLRGREKVLRV